MSFLTNCFVLVSVTFWATRAIVVVYHVFQFWDIKVELTGVGEKFIKFAEKEYQVSKRGRKYHGRGEE